jgi:hypothetical protein
MLLSISRREQDSEPIDHPWSKQNNALHDQGRKITKWGKKKSNTMNRRVN